MPRAMYWIKVHEISKFSELMGGRVCYRCIRFLKIGKCSSLLISVECLRGPISRLRRYGSPGWNVIYGMLNFLKLVWLSNRLLFGFMFLLLKMFGFCFYRSWQLSLFTGRRIGLNSISFRNSYEFSFGRVCFCCNGFLKRVEK